MKPFVALALVGLGLAVLHGFEGHHVAAVGLSLASAGVLLAGYERPSTTVIRHYQIPQRPRVPTLYRRPETADHVAYPLRPAAAPARPVGFNVVGRLRRAASHKA